MAVERRLHTRKLIDARVRIYHSSFGTREGRIRDISDGGCCITLVETGTDFPELDDNSEEFVTLTPLNMDVVFKMQFVRRHENGVVLRFDQCVEGTVNTDAL